MIIVLDSTALALLIRPDARPPDDPATGKALVLARERVTKLVSDLDAKTDVLVIPTPVLAEVLVRAEGGAPALFEQLRGLARVRIQPFNQAAAIEVAAMTIEAKSAGDKKAGHPLPWQRVKFDRQIIATARVVGAARIYSDDRDLVGFARRLGMDAFSTWDLAPPESEANLFTAAGVAIEPIAEALPAQSLSTSSPVEPVDASDSDENDADGMRSPAQVNETDDLTDFDEPDQGDESSEVSVEDVPGPVSREAPEDRVAGKGSDPEAGDEPERNNVTDSTQSG